MTHVHLLDIAKHWDRVKVGLERIALKAAPNWNVEDVRVALMSGEAVLSLVDGGFVIWQRYPGDDRQGMLFILAAEGQRSSGPEHYNAELVELATQLRCRVVRMISPRKGWQREPFWSMTGYVYEHEVTRCP